MRMAVFQLSSLERWMTEFESILYINKTKQTCELLFLEREGKGEGV